MNLYSTKIEIQKALLVGLELPQQTESEVTASLDELERLVTTLGYKVIGRLSQKRSGTKGAVVLGDGKLKELSEWTGGAGIVAPTFVKKKHKAALKFGRSDEFDEGDDEDFVNDNASDGEAFFTPTELAQVVIFDCELSPAQLRNLESATGATVLDRTGVIIEIFSRHARTKAARLQVEIARLNYIAPRLRETGGGEDRGGGGVGSKGAGESALELDRRKIRDRIKELKMELSNIGTEQDVRRHQRHSEFCVALVGYTNAGKSSLMRALTGSEVLVADKLFATLDTTVRTLYPETQPKILISDTVGFIKKLPHDLVASFKSTLDEAHNASLLLYVVDASDDFFRSQLEVTRAVLAEVGVESTPSFLIFNKRDRLSKERVQELKAEFPEALFLSTKDPEDIKELRNRLIENFETNMQEVSLKVPYSTQGAVGEIRAHMRVIRENFDEQGVTFRVRAKAQDLERFRKKYQIDILE